MIKKILSTLLVSSVIFLAAATSAIAIDRPSIAYWCVGELWCLLYSVLERNRR